MIIDSDESFTFTYSTEEIITEDAIKEKIAELIENKDETLQKVTYDCSLSVTGNMFYPRYIHSNGREAH